MHFDMVTFITKNVDGRLLYSRRVLYIILGSHLPIRVGFVFHLYHIWDHGSLHRLLICGKLVFLLS